MDRFQTLQAIATPQQQHQNGAKKEPTRISHGGHHHNRPSIDSASSGMSLYRKSFSSSDPSNSSFSSSVAGSIQVCADSFFISYLHSGESLVFD